MPATIQQKIALGGEKEYREAIAQINTSLRTMDAELRLATERYRDNASGMEALTAKSELLRRKQEEQRKAVEETRAIWQRAVETYGESSKEAQRLQKTLADQETALLKTEHAIQDNEAAMRQATESTADYGDAVEETGEQSTSLGDAVDQLAGKLGVKLPAGAKKSLDALGGIDPKLVAVAGGAAAAAAAIVKAERALIDMTKEAAAAADDLATLSTVTGVSTDALQKWQYAANLIDVDVSTITGSLTKLTNNMQAARDGSDAMQGAFTRLGVTVTNADGSLRDAQTVFLETVDALGRVYNATERDALAMDIFGKSAQDLNPLISQGSAALQDLGEEAEKAGYVLSGKQVNALLAVSDAQERYNKQLDAGKKQISAEFAPAVEELYSTGTELIRAVGQGLKSSGLLQYGKDLLGVLTDIGKKLTDGVGKIEGWLDKMRSMPAGLQGPLESLAAFADLIGIVTSLFSGDFSGVKTHLGLNVKNGQLSYLQQWRYGGSNNTNVYDPVVGGWVGNYNSTIPGNAGGTDWWRGGWTWVGEHGAELVQLPAGSRISTAQESRAAAGAVYMTIHVDHINDLQDLLRIQRDAEILRRMGGDAAWQRM